jgi:hypothetical protein
MRVALWSMVIAVLFCGAVVVACGEREPAKTTGTTASQPAPKAPEPAPKPPEPKPEPPAPQPEPPPPEPKPEPKPEPPAPKPEPAGDQLTAWGKCKVGDWFKVKMQGGMLMTYEVVKVGDKSVTVKMTTEMQGMAMPATEQEFDKFVKVVAPPAGAPPVPAMEDLGTETLEVAGKKLECKVMQTKMDVMGKSVTTKTWMCESIPSGPVKTMSDMTGSMEVAMELIDFKVN